MDRSKFGSEGGEERGGGGGVKVNVLPTWSTHQVLQGERHHTLVAITRPTRISKYRYYSPEYFCSPITYDLSLELQRLL